MSKNDERLQRYLLGEMSLEERSAYEDEVLANEDLVDEIYADENARAAIETAVRARRERALRASATSPHQAWWRRGLGRWLIPAAAVAAVVTFALLRPSPTLVPAPVFRGEGTELSAIGPEGDVPTVPQRFLWHPGKAATYRFELFDASSTRIFSTVTSDTFVTPKDVAIPANGYWTVTPLNDLNMTSGDRILSSYRVHE